jgi:hypothetical protein
MVDIEQIKRWRLILGEAGKQELENLTGRCVELNADELIMDEALAAIYDNSTADAGESGSSGRRTAGKGPSAPMIAKWLGDIRTYFPEDVVAVIQTDAIERKGLKQLLFEPEVLKTVQPNIEIVATLMALRGKIPERTKETARQLVRAVVEEIKKRLASDIQRAVTGAINKKKHSPIPNTASIDWKYTINKNLKNYNTQHRKLILERVFFFDRARKSNNWHIILDMDQSGSMADSIIYGSIAGSIFASLPALNTRIVAFDTEVVDLSEQYDNDPVDMLFGIQLGGGTDINKSVAYCQQYITDPSKTLFILLTDLFEGGNAGELVRRMEEMHKSGVKVMNLLALSDHGTPCYDEGLARRLSKIGIPCFACTPTLLPDLLEGALKGSDLNALAARLTAKR